jgi:hypothetical protein
MDNADEIPDSERLATRSAREPHCSAADAWPTTIQNYPVIKSYRVSLIISPQVLGYFGGGGSRASLRRRRPMVVGVPVAWVVRSDRAYHSRSGVPRASPLQVGRRRNSTPTRRCKREDFPEFEPLGCGRHATDSPGPPVLFRRGSCDWQRWERDQFLIYGLHRKWKGSGNRPGLDPNDGHVVVVYTHSQ